MCASVCMRLYPNYICCRALLVLCRKLNWHENRAAEGVGSFKFILEKLDVRSTRAQSHTADNRGWGNGFHLFRDVLERGLDTKLTINNEVVRTTTMIIMIIILCFAIFNGSLRQACAHVCLHMHTRKPACLHRCLRACQRESVRDFEWRGRVLVFVGLPAHRAHLCVHMCARCECVHAGYLCAFLFSCVCTCMRRREHAWRVSSCTCAHACACVSAICALVNLCLRMHMNLCANTRLGRRFAWPP